MASVLRTRIRSKVIIQEDGCWIWTGAVSKYPKIRIGGRKGSTYSVHTVSYRVWVGPIPKGSEIHHTCEVKLCVNPDHLIALTPDEHRAITYGRYQVGDQWYCKKGHKIGYDKTCEVCVRATKRHWYRRNSNYPT